MECRSRKASKVLHKQEACRALHCLAPCATALQGLGPKYGTMARTVCLTGVAGCVNYVPLCSSRAFYRSNVVGVVRRLHKSAGFRELSHCTMYDVLQCTEMSEHALILRPQLQHWLAEASGVNRRLSSVLEANGRQGHMPQCLSSLSALLAMLEFLKCKMLDATAYVINEGASPSASNASS